MGYQVSTGDDDFHLARREMGNAKAAENEEIGDKLHFFFSEILKLARGMRWEMASHHS